MTRGVPSDSHGDAIPAQLELLLRAASCPVVKLSTCPVEDLQEETCQ